MLAAAMGTSTPRALLLVSVLAGCGANVSATPPATTDAAGADASANADAAPADDTPAVDAGPTERDAGSPDLDGGPAVTDVERPVDVVRPIDARPPVDVVRPADVPRLPGSTVAGRWRAVRYQYPDPDRGVIELTDRDVIVPLPDGGMGSPFRINGVLSLDETRLALALGTVSSNHFYPFTPTSADDPGWSTTGFTVPGLLTVTAGSVDFEIVGGDNTLRFERTADDELVMLDESSGTRTTFARDPTPASLDRVNLIGIVWQDPAVRPATPRAVLRWDLPGAGVFRDSHDVALTFSTGPYTYATVPVAMASAPAADLVATTAGVRVASAYVLVYDDANANDRFDQGTDAVLAQSPVGLAWRGPETPEEGFARSAFADLVPGWQVVHYHRDYATGRYAVTPYDNTVAPSPDALLRPGYVAATVELR